MIKKLRKLVLWKYFSSKVKLSLALAVVLLLVLLNNSSVFNNFAEAYPFIEAAEYKVLDDPRHAVEGDFNGDGDLDVAIVNFRASYVSVALNNGDATFKDSVNYSSGGIGPLGVAAGNFDGDADIDLAVVNYISGDIRLLINNGSGVFSLDPTTYLAGTRPSSIVSDDFNGDGSWDLAVTNTGSDNFSVLLGDGVGGFGAATDHVCGTSPLQIISADLNNDTKKDLVIVNGGISVHGNSISIHFGIGDGNFQAPVYHSISVLGYAGKSVAVTIGDFDNDSDLDLAFTAMRFSLLISGFGILENDGLGNFSQTVNTYALGKATLGVGAGDFNNDGDLDVAVTNFADDTVSIFPGNGDLTFGGVQNFNVGRGPIYILAADFDGDAKKDIITLNKGENRLSSTPPLYPLNNSFSFLRNNGIVIIESDDVTFVREGGASDTYQVVLSSLPTNNVTITISHDVSQLDMLPLPVILTFTPADWDTPQTVTVSAVDDPALEGNHFSLITHSAVSLDPNFNSFKIPDVNVAIADNDQAGVTVYESGGFSEVAEGGATDQYTVVLETAPTDNVVITINSGTQMTALPSVLTFTNSNWDTPQTVTITAIDDYFIEGLEQRVITHNVVSSDLIYNGIAANNVNVDLLDNNFLSHIPLCVGLAGDLVYNFQVNGLDYEQIKKIIIGADPQNNCGDFDHDNFVCAGDLNILNSFIVRNYYETPEVIITESVGSTAIIEGGATDTYLMYLRRRPTVDVIVDIDVNSQLSTDKTQLVFTNLNFFDPQEVTVIAVDDFFVEASPHVGSITHTALSGDYHYNGLAVASITGNITDNDTAGVTVTESGGGTTVNETGETSDNIFMRLTSVPTADVTIDLSTPDGQSTVLPTQLIFTPLDWNINQELIITAVDDDMYEDPSHFGHILGAMSSLDLNYQGSGSWDTDIIDNDVLPTLSISSVSKVETDMFATTFNFAVTLSAVAGMTTVVDFNTANGTATVADNDYQADAGQLIFNSGQILKTVPITVRGDTNIESTENFYINLTNPINATILTSQGVGTIIDDDSPVTTGTTIPALGTIINLSCEPVSNEINNWNFDDISANETGYRLYELVDVNTSELILEINEQNLTHIQESGLSTNTQYTRYIVVFNNTNQTDPSNEASCYTLANRPLSLILGESIADSIQIIIDNNDGNPENTEYAIFEFNNEKYVQADGSFGDTEDWQTYDEWGTSNGVYVLEDGVAVNEESEINLFANQTYDFATKAKNGDGIETLFSPGTGDDIVVEEPVVMVSKGVEIMNNDTQISRVFVKAVLATSGGANQSISERLIIEFSLFLNIILVILIVLLLISIYKAIKHIQVKGFCKKLKLSWNVLCKEPVKVFVEHTEQNKKGTYNNSYEKYKRLHEYSQKTVASTLGVIILKLIILIFFILGVVGVNHQSVAELASYNHDGQGIMSGDILSYQISFVNQSDVTATNVIITDIMDSYVSYVDGSGALFTEGIEIVDAFNNLNQQISFLVGDLASGQSGYAIFNVQINSDEVGRQITNQAQIGGDNFSSVLTNTVVNTIIEIPEEDDLIVIPEDEDPIVTPEDEDPIVIPEDDDLIETPEDEDPIVIPEDDDLIETPADDDLITTPEGSTLLPGATPPTTPSIVELPETTPSIGKLSIMNTVRMGFFDNQRLESFVENIVTPIFLLLAALNTIPTALLLTWSILLYLHLLFLEPFLWFFRKKREKWGIVYDSLTKMPISLAVVRLYSKETKKLVQTKVTDKEGRYLMIVKNSGKYFLSVTKTGYIFPTELLISDHQNAKYPDLYHGEEVDVSENGIILAANIPLDKLEQKISLSKDVLRGYLINNLRLIVSYIGIILAILVVIIIPTIITIGALIIHLVLFVIFRKLIVPKKPKNWGIIYDEKTSKPLRQVVVRIFDNRFNKLLETQVTDRKGRYSFLVGKNEYQLLTEKQGYDQKTIKPVDLINKERIVNFDIGLEQL